MVHSYECGKRGALQRYITLKYICRIILYVSSGTVTSMFQS